MNPGALSRELEGMICDRQLRAPLKSLIDYMIYLEPIQNNPKVSKAVAGNLRGYWSHFVARWVCGFITPILSVISSVVVLSAYHTFFKGGFFLCIESLQDAHMVWWMADATLIFLLSFVLLVVAHRPKDEAFDLEYYVVKPLIHSLIADPSYKDIWDYFVERVSEANKLDQVRTSDPNA